jgi:hypothetical protein
MLGLAYLMPGCWLEVSLHPEGPATGQLDQGFPWFSLVPEKMLSCYPNSTLHATHAALPMATLKISPCTNVTLTLGCITLFIGGYARGRPTPRRKKLSNKESQNLVIGFPAPRRIGRLSLGRNIT